MCFLVMWHMLGRRIHWVGSIGPIVRYRMAGTLTIARAPGVVPAASARRLYACFRGFLALLTARLRSWVHHGYAAMTGKTATEMGTQDQMMSLMNTADSRPSRNGSASQWDQCH